MQGFLIVTGDALKDGALALLIGLFSMDYSSTVGPSWLAI
jgi:hypothetical protein